MLFGPAIRHRLTPDEGHSGADILLAEWRGVGSVYAAEVHQEGIGGKGVRLESPPFEMRAIRVYRVEGHWKYLPSLFFRCAER